MEALLKPFATRKLNLKNHLVMAPMTRSRALDNMPNELMAAYYGQRAGAGLIITEGTAPSPEALGYPRIPGIFSERHVLGWQAVTKAVHEQGSKIFLQLMHTGRIGHRFNLPEGYTLVGPSSIKAEGEIYTDVAGNQAYEAPAALTMEGIKGIITQHVTAAQNAMRAGFDGVELHGANGYLMEQFLNPNVNNRTDAYGGSPEHCANLVVETVAAMAAAIGADKVGVRFSPYATLGDLAPYDEQETHDTYAYLATKLNELDIAYLHIGVTTPLSHPTLKAIRSRFKGVLILCNGFTPESAASVMEETGADLVAFGRTFLANPDLDQRIAAGAALNAPDYATLYTPGPKGYTDYPTLQVPANNAIQDILIADSLSTTANS